MSISDQMAQYDTLGTEDDLAQGIVTRIAAGIPELNDHSPGSPHVVMAEAMAWGASLLAYYAQQQPAMLEEYIVSNLFHATAQSGVPAQALLLMTFSTPAPVAGRTIPAGTQFTGGGATWTVINPYTFPVGSYGNDTITVEGRTSYVYLVPVFCNMTGSTYNIIANTITGVTTIIPGLQSVTNPDPAFGGLDAEDYTAMRDRYFAARNNDNALVLPLDYERAASDYLGMGTRVLTVTPPPTPGYAHLAILLADGTPLIDNPKLEIFLDQRSPMAPVRFVPPTMQSVNISANVQYDPAHTTADALKSSIHSELMILLTPQTWSGWGSMNNMVYLSAIISAIQNASGVRGVELLEPTSNINLGEPYAVPQLGTITINAIPVSAT